MQYAVILVYQPDGSVKDIQLTSDQVVIGRSDDCDVIIEGKLISRHHACIRKQKSGYVIEDLQSQNGTLLNGKYIKDIQHLSDGDVIELGGMGKLVFSDSESTSSFLSASIVGIWLDVEKQDIWIDGICLNPKLSPAQYKMMEVLFAKKDLICTRAEIVSAVWPNVTEGVSEEAIDALIKRVRARLAEVNQGDQYLITLRSRGLMLKSPETR